MRLGMIALCCGLLCLRFLPVLPVSACLLLAAAGLGLLLSRLYPLGLFLLGVAWAAGSAQLALDDRLPVELDGQTLWLQGQVVGLPEQGDGVVRFYLQQAESRRAPLPQRLRLSWYGAPALAAGEVWRLAVSLKRPRGLVNPHAFDYEAWLTARRIGASGTVKAGERLSMAGGPASWRDNLRSRLLAVQARGREGALAALVLGDGSGLDDADWRILQTTGTVHLLVISGQHVMLLGSLLYALVLGLFRLGWWPRHWPWLPCACALAMFGALAYGLLAGFEVPVQRACAMLAVVLLWRWRFRHLGIWLPLLVALTLVLMWEPLASLQPGFWLSFAAVALLAWCFSGRLGTPGGWRVLVHAQWAMALGLLPLLLALGLPVSLGGPLANLVAVPWVSIGVVPLALLGTLLLPLPGIGSSLLWLAGAQLELLFALLGWLAERVPVWQFAAAPWWAVVLGLVGVLLALSPRGLPLRLCGGLMLLPLLCPPLPRLSSGLAEVHQLDVGQGLAVLVRTRSHALLYDAGPAGRGFDSGEKVVLPMLRGLGVRRLDLLLLSHADQDHAGGAAALLAGLPVERLLSGEVQALRLSRSAEDCRDGEQWQWDGVHFSTWRWQRADNPNDGSCLLQVEARGERLLLTGDIGEAGERHLLASGRDLRADWLQAPHHGSRGSSSAAFVAAVAPRAVLLSRAWHNPFGHPHAAVLARYRQAGARIYDSARHGALRLLLGRRGGAEAARTQTRFWREK
ncbi:DNA internalization-related competence protein ComEC/Rec2 [Pseudomonas sp. MAP12]|uniref:DNA internalization-related competence protein ComEC/Rec2 n=1 Tax=Geopseudomonas aromaticivorans TaxID=2849492 RepID=A0ABS6MSS7_9GAMM|nr:DNA internalization-related competence protein ComEC/Rec2 [Pseudomonas aromaticivorans]MBV2131327.1 DNA internalization-related competence protein ComEC/Rec2 [Pseudomonas aromaticivorans]